MLLSMIILVIVSFLANDIKKESAAADQNEKSDCEWRYSLYFFLICLSNLALIMPLLHGLSSDILNLHNPITVQFTHYYTVNASSKKIQRLQ